MDAAVNHLTASGNNERLICYLEYCFIFEINNDDNKSLLY